MLISDFDYHLPEQSIAQEPLEQRSLSRMLVLDRDAETFADHTFADLPRFLRSGDVVVLNNTKVFPARLIGRSETGASVEIFLVEELGEGKWLTLARPARRLKQGKRVDFGTKLSAEVVEKTDEGKTVVRFDADGDFFDLVAELGKTPLPPYIKREREASDRDRERYQTVYAKQRGAIAAPTAGLHFTPETLDKLKNDGVEIAEVTLHVGYGTFEPVRVDDVSGHSVMPERYEIDTETADLLNTAKNENRRIVAIGTTTTRALETNFAAHRKFDETRANANLTILPGYKFRAIDGLLTNFHLPQSSLLVLVSTFGGHEFIMKAYEHAVRAGYRFYSYGDCMLIM